VNKTHRARNGQTVVALVNNHATVKRYYKKGDKVELHPANPEYKPIIIESMVDIDSDFRIAGIVVGVIRHLESYID
jgi:repressor LexA